MLTSYINSSERNLDHVSTNVGVLCGEPETPSSTMISSTPQLNHSTSGA